MTDLVAGRLDLLFFSMAGAMPQIKAGKVIALGGAAKENPVSGPSTAHHPKGSSTFTPAFLKSRVFRVTTMKP